VRVEFMHLLAYEDGTDRVFRNSGIYNSDAYSIQYTAKVWNQDLWNSFRL